MRGGRILVAWYSQDYSSANLTTTASAVTLNLPDGTTSATLPADVQSIDLTNTAASDGVRVLMAGKEVMVAGSAYSQSHDVLLSKGATVTLKSVFGTVSSGKLYIAFYN